MQIKWTRVFFNTIIICTVTVGFASAYKNDLFSYNRSPDKWDVFAGVGYTNYLDGTQNQSIKVTPTENDLLQQQTHGNGVGYFIGAQRTYFLDNNTIPEIAIGPTLSYDPVHIEGQVYQYEMSPLLNNYRYVYKAKPVDTALEAQILLPKVTLFNKVAIAPYALIGGGMSAVSLDYAETALPGIPGGALSGTHTVIRPLGIFGAGLQWGVAKHGFVRTEYRYHYRDDAGFTPNGSVGKVLINLNEQSADVLFGYSFK